MTVGLARMAPRRWAPLPLMRRQSSVCHKMMAAASGCQLLPRMRSTSRWPRNRHRHLSRIARKPGEARGMLCQMRPQPQGLSRCTHRPFPRWRARSESAAPGEESKAGAWRGAIGPALPRPAAVLPPVDDRGQGKGWSLSFVVYSTHSSDDSSFFLCFPAHLFFLIRLVVNLLKLELKVRVSSHVISLQLPTVS